MARLIYLRRCIEAQFSSRAVSLPELRQPAKPDHGSQMSIVAQLRRCGRCSMMFRTPTDDPRSNAEFYESEYSQGSVTECPSDAELENLKRTDFLGTERNYSYYIGVMGQLGLRPGAKLFDFGCSWGYGSYQFAKAGFDVTAFEVAPTLKAICRGEVECPGGE